MNGNVQILGAKLILVYEIVYIYAYFMDIQIFGWGIWTFDGTLTISYLKCPTLASLVDFPTLNAGYDFFFELTWTPTAILIFE